MEKKIEELFRDVDFVAFSSKLEKLCQKRISLSKVKDVSSRNFQFWRESGAVLYETGKWVKLDFFQYAWLVLVSSLREFGYPMKKIVEIRTHFFASLQTSEFFEEIPLSSILKPLKEKIMKNFTGSEQDLEKALAQINETMLEHELKKKGISFDYWSLLHIYIIMRRLEMGILIDSNKNFTVWTEKPILEEKADYSVFFKNHVYYSLTQTIKDFFENTEYFEHVFEFDLFSEKEWDLLADIRSGDYTEIIVHLDGKKIKRLSCKANIDPRKRLIEILKLNNFQTIEISQKEGKIIHVKSTISKK